MVQNTAKNIQFGSIGAIDVYDKHTHGYYMVEFTSLPYTLQENKTIDGQIINASELVANEG